MESKVTVETTEKTPPAVVQPIPPRATTKQIIAHVLLEFFERITSRKMWMVIFACSIPWLGLERGVNHLYALQQWQAAVYGSMFLCVMGAITAIVCKYMGIENVNVSAATSVSGIIQAAAQNVTEKKESHETIETIERDFRTPELQERYGDK